MNQFSHDELMKICDDMIRFGGSFSVSLAKSFLNADNTNRRRLIEAFPEFFQKGKSLTTHVKMIELDFNEETPEGVLALIASELYKDPHHRRFFGQISGLLKSESVLSSAETSQKQNGDFLQ